MWHTHNPNMHQRMQSCWRKLQYIWQQVHYTIPCIHLGPYKNKPKLEIYLIYLPHTSSPLPTNIIHDLILKSLQDLPTLIMIKPTQYMFPIQPLYHFLNHIITQSLFPTPNTFNYR